MSKAPPLGTALAAAAILSLASPVVEAQPWSGILDQSRAADWTTAGVVGGIPSGSWPACTTAACNTLLGGNVTAATIESALACSPACPSSGPTQVTISPGLGMPNWRASQAPGAYWVDSPPLHNSGLENLTVDFTAGGGSGIFIKDAANCWLNGTRWIKTDPGTSEAYHVFTIQSAHLTIRSNYVYGRPTPVFPFPLANYSYTDQEVSDIVYENNIHHHNVGPMIPNDDDAVYVLGWQGNASGGMVANDPDVIRTLMRWGNYDSVNDAVRFVLSEVPSGIPNFANPVPASQALPASFYLIATPPWWMTAWGTPPWPAIGPDVTGGPLAFSGGHAYAIPARLCFEHLPDDPAYPSSDPRIKSFDAATCYPESPVPVELLSFSVE